MKALSIRQPWAGLILSGEKTIETRTWATRYRGDILICVSAKLDAPGAGNALCLVRLVDCRMMTPADEHAACCPVYPGAWAWVLTDVRPIAPFPLKGKLGLFDVTLSPESLQPIPDPAADPQTESPQLALYTLA